MESPASGLFDVFGPVMIGPSSSHTAGVCRLANVARVVFSRPFGLARVRFFGSLAATWRGHGSDLAATAGLLGMRPDDERLSFATELASRQGISVVFVEEPENPEHYHPNTAVFELSGGGASLRLRGASTGGGNILVQSVNGYAMELRGGLEAIMVRHRDRIGVIADVSRALSSRGVNIASASSHRSARGDEALLVVEIDGSAPAAAIEGICALDSVLEATRIPAIEP